MTPEPVTGLPRTVRYNIACDSIDVTEHHDLGSFNRWLATLPFNERVDAIVAYRLEALHFIAGQFVREVKRYGDYFESAVEEMKDRAGL